MRFGIILNGGSRPALSRQQELEGRFLLGSPAECIAEVARYRAVGVEELIMRCQWPGMAVEPTLQAIQRFARDVLPQCVA
jgi:alkanesulfonate monooxygenase SsuD/methylene tetrahydromethanopterin reductase-like flavin-dependent oxidoreductase (luciferase family)